LGWFGARPCA